MNTMDISDLFWGGGGFSSFRRSCCFATKNFELLVAHIFKIKIFNFN